MFNDSFKYFISGSVNCRLAVVLPGIGPFFAMSLLNDVIYYTDWGAASLVQYSLRSNVSRNLVTGLQRPSRFVIHQAQNSSHTTGDCVLHCFNILL
jgi:hypothetical protein